MPFSMQSIRSIFVPDYEGLSLAKRRFWNAVFPFCFCLAWGLVLISPQIFIILIGLSAIVYLLFSCFLIAQYSQGIKKAKEMRQPIFPFVSKIIAESLFIALGLASMFAGPKILGFVGMGVGIGVAGIALAIYCVIQMIEVMGILRTAWSDSQRNGQFPWSLMVKEVLPKIMVGLAYGAVAAAFIIGSIAMVSTGALPVWALTFMAITAIVSGTAKLLFEGYRWARMAYANCHGSADERSHLTGSLETPVATKRIARDASTSGTPTAYQTAPRPNEIPVHVSDAIGNFEL